MVQNPVKYRLSLNTKRRPSGTTPLSSPLGVPVTQEGGFREVERLVPGLGRPNPGQAQTSPGVASGVTRRKTMQHVHKRCKIVKGLRGFEFSKEVLGNLQNPFTGNMMLPSIVVSDSHPTMQLTDRYIVISAWTVLVHDMGPCNKRGRL